MLADGGGDRLKLTLGVAVCGSLDLEVSSAISLILEINAADNIISRTDGILNLQMLQSDLLLILILG